MKRNYIVFVRDHSGSMRSIARPAARDYNFTIAAVKEAALANNQDTIVSVVKCGHGSRAIVHTEILESSISVLQPIAEYQADACGTPLFASIDRAIEICQAVPDFTDPEVSFLIYATTDGQETENRFGGKALGQKIKRLQNTDRWTFAFRVPRGDAQALISHGIPEGNVLEWEQSERGMAAAQVKSKEAFTAYFTSRSAGMTSTGTFFANLENVASGDVQAALEDISNKVLLWPVSTTEHEVLIREFVETRLKGKPLLKGSAFYMLTKKENKVQANKRICIRDKTNNAIYYGEAARQLLGLPVYDDIRLAPDKLGNFDVFIQSTSVNRKVQQGTQILYWEDVGQAYTSGPSART